MKGIVMSMESGNFSPKERLLMKLRGENTDRPPVICPGGMLNAAIVEVMEHTGHVLPDGHTDAGIMTLLARDISELTGFENYGVPFCMTVEAEALGSSIDLGSISCEPKIAKERFASVSEALLSSPIDAGDHERVATIASAVNNLAGGDVPVIGSITGPVSAAASLVDPMVFFKELHKDKENAHRVLNIVTDWLIDYAVILCDNGADVITIADPTATGELLGPRYFEEYGLPYINRMVETIQGMATPVIVHICGQISSIAKHVAKIKGDAISTDAVVNLRLLKKEYPHLTTMGNMSTIRLEQGTPDGVTRGTDVLLRNGIDIIAPACGLGTATPLKNIAAFTSRVKEK